MITSALLLLIIAVGVVAIAVLLAYIWTKDPFKTALGSCLSSVVVLVGSLSVPSVQGKTDISIDVGFASLAANGVAISTATPTVLWVIAFLSIVLLVALFATLIFLRDRARLAAPTKPGRVVGDDGSLGGPVF